MPIRFSTDGLSERDRIPAWRDFFGPLVLRAEIEPAPDLPFHAHVTVRRLPDICVVSQAKSSPVCLSRTPALLADGNDDFVLFVCSAGGTVTQRGREITFNAGDAVLMTAAEIASCVSRTAAQFRCIHLQRSALAPFATNLDDALLQLIPPGTNALRYLLDYAHFAQEDGTLVNPEVARLAALHLRDLFALVVGATRDAAMVAGERGLRVARLQAIKRYIAENLGHRGLTVVEVAAQHHVTPRYVQRLFEREGTTFSEYLLNQRLAHAHRLLVDPHCAVRTVSAIALKAGFGDVSYFNRCFRRRFGGTPTQFRGTIDRYSSP